MSVDVTMPRLSDSMEEGTIVQWLKQAGDTVALGDVLAEIETDKATMAFEADSNGVLLEIVVPEGVSVPLGAVIARIGSPGAVVTAPSAGGMTVTGGVARPKASPVARRLARVLGVDLNALGAGSGPRGRIVKADVQGAHRAPATLAAHEVLPSAAPEGANGERTVVPLTRIQARVARRMAESKATVPEFTLHIDVDMSACVELRQQLSAMTTPAPSFNDMIVKAAALALTEFPRANGSYSDGKFLLNRRVNVGIAVAAEDSLVVPTVFDANTKSLGTIAADSRRLAAAVRDGTIVAGDLSGGTFTISNLGMYGVTSFSAIINPPQAAILSVGAIERRPVVGDDGAIVPRHVLTLGLICDHRILYGADAAQFLSRVRDVLTTPLSMAL